MLTIYGLIDPRTTLLRYVGKSYNPIERFSQHIRDCSRERTRKANWIRSLLKLGLKPQLEILETVEGSGNIEERFYIALFRAFGADLVNATAGGDGVEFTAEIRAKMSAAQLGKKRGPWPSSVRAKIGAASSARLKGRKPHPAMTLAQRRAITGVSKSLEHRAKIATALKGHRVSAETRAKIGAANRSSRG